jgi:predicted RNase H-like nuclease (RuvC/YqgF family)
VKQIREIEAATAEAQKQIDEARQQAEDERAATEAVRAEAGQLERAIAEKDAEIASLLTRLEEIQRTTGELRAACAIADQKAEGERRRAERGEAEAQASRQERIASDYVVPDNQVQILGLRQVGPRSQSCRDTRALCRIGCRVPGYHPHEPVRGPGAHRLSEMPSELPAGVWTVFHRR